WSAAISGISGVKFEIQYISGIAKGIFDAVLKGHIDFQSVLKISDSAKDLIEKKKLSHCSSERLKDHEVLSIFDIFLHLNLLALCFIACLYS
uniref:Uncharacterized protein n=1 Tax=Oryza glaberrima TaxID=4538 RepID=I1R5T5_ORYGL